MGVAPASIETERLQLVSVDPASDTDYGIPDVLLERMRRHPERAEWVTRLMRLRTTGEIAGHCGFHGPPEVIGRAEIGYTVFEPFRGRGFATEAARELCNWAFAQGVEEVFASVSPENAPSLAVVGTLGFVQVGTQEDEEDGLELVFKLTPRP
ncbi:MAG TPA: GNAT family N-acetyltransferase [Candidatus Dormibacteraeota bacterium]